MSETIDLLKVIDDLLGASAQFGGFRQQHGAYNAICGYCGEMVEEYRNGLWFDLEDKHKPDCPVAVGMRLLKEAIETCPSCDGDGTYLYNGTRCECRTCDDKRGWVLKGYQPDFDGAGEIS